MTSKLITTAGILALAGCASVTSGPEDKDAVATIGTLAVAKQFLNAAGSGDGATLMALTDDDFVWHNEGDKRLPWIGHWQGKERVFGTFMPAFGQGLSVTTWTTDYEFVNGDQAVFILDIHYPPVLSASQLVRLHKRYNTVDLISLDTTQ